MNNYDFHDYSIPSEMIKNLTDKERENLNKRLCRQRKAGIKILEASDEIIKNENITEPIDIDSVMASCAFSLVKKTKIADKENALKNLLTLLAAIYSKVYESVKED
jgi:hypothetical protein